MTRQIMSWNKLTRKQADKEFIGTLSLQAIEGVLVGNTLKIIGKLEGHSVSVLIDSGSTTKWGGGVEWWPMVRKSSVE